MLLDFTLRKRPRQSELHEVAPLQDRSQIFYKAFSICATLQQLKGRIAAEKPDYERWRIHVLASQTADGAITLGEFERFTGGNMCMFD